MFKLGCCGSKIRVADNFNRSKNITLKFAAAAATLVTDQVVQCVSASVQFQPKLAKCLCLCLCLCGRECQLAQFPWILRH